MHSTPFYFTKYSNEDQMLVSVCYVVISDHLALDTNPVTIFQEKFIEALKGQAGFNKTKLYYISYNCTGQYKTLKNFINFLNHRAEDAEWHFHAAGHGKNRCNAIGTVVKRATKLECLRFGRKVRS